jgi:streptomycin 6-kinase
VSQAVTVPDLVLQRARSNGRAGQRWLDDLPQVVGLLASRWQLELGAAMAGGTASFVSEATDAGGRPCVLKVAMPLDVDETSDFRRAVSVHGLADGRGCARLLAFDTDVPAMLLERLGPNLHDLGMPLPSLLETITSTLRSFWRPVPEDVALRSGAEQAQWLARFIVDTWERLERPCQRAVIDRSVTLCDALAAAYDPATAVLVHGDAHGWNTLDAGGGTFKFVDPEGYRSSKEHDLAVAMREYNGPLLAGETARLAWERAEMLAARCDADPQAVWEWGFIERVSTGLAGLRDFDDLEGEAFLEVAARCL